jgi:hypothetical protein
VDSPLTTITLSAQLLSERSFRCSDDNCDDLMEEIIREGGRKEVKHS